MVIRNAPDEKTEAETRCANECVLGVEAQARSVFELLYSKGDAVQQAVASAPIKRGMPERLVARYRGTAPTMFEVFRPGNLLVIQFANREAVVDFVRERLFGEMAS